MDFLKKYTSNPTLETNLYTFFFNGIILNSPSFIDKPLKDILEENCTIRFISKQDGYKNEEAGLLKFNISDNESIRSVSYDPNISIREMLMDFLKKYTSNPTLDLNEYIFAINCIILNSPKFIDKPLKDILQENCTIRFTRKVFLG